MSVSRAFLTIASLYLLIGLLFGMYMGGSGDHSLAPVHAHINLLGFTLMTLFGLVYRVIPVMEDGWMARAHLWLHQIGSLVLLLGLFLLISGRLPETTIGPLMPFAEAAVLIGVILFTLNLWRKVK